MKLIGSGHFVQTPIQWETTLQYNVVSHWLGAYTNWSLTWYINHKVWSVVYRINVAWDDCRLMFIPDMIYYIFFIEFLRIHCRVYSDTLKDDGGKQFNYNCVVTWYGPPDLPRGESAAAGLTYNCLFLTTASNVNCWADVVNHVTRLWQAGDMEHFERRITGEPWAVSRSRVAQSVTG